MYKFTYHTRQVLGYQTTITITGQFVTRQSRLQRTLQGGERVCGRPPTPRSRRGENKGRRRSWGGWKRGGLGWNSRPPYIIAVRGRRPKVILQISTLSKHHPTELKPTSLHFLNNKQGMRGWFCGRAATKIPPQGCRTAEIDTFEQNPIPSGRKFQIIEEPG